MPPVHFHLTNWWFTARDTAHYYFRHPKGAKPEDKPKGELTEKEAKDQKLRESLEAVKITVAVSASKSEGEHMDEARRLAIGAEVSSSETQLSGLSSSLVLRAL
jgi:hypothetical protein